MLEEWPRECPGCGAVIYNEDQGLAHLEQEHPRVYIALLGPEDHGNPDYSLTLTEMWQRERNAGD